MPYRYINELSIKTTKKDTIHSLNAILEKVGSKQRVYKGKTRPYLRLEHFSKQGRFTDKVFELGEVITVRLTDKIEWY